MTRKIKRLKDVDIILQVKNEDFIRPPREAQRNWLLNRAIKEFSDNLMHLDASARRYVSGAKQDYFEDRTQAERSDQEIMEDWQIPVMKAMARLVAEAHGDVLEIGFGRGISSDFIQAEGVASHTIVECNDLVVDAYHVWKKQYPGQDIRLLHGLWQDKIEAFQHYDGIFFHTYPLNEEEFFEYVVQSATFAAHFFPTAAACLKERGVFTYLTNETDSFSRGHQRLLFEYFRSFTLEKVGPLRVPEDSIDSFWGDTMVVVKAVK